MMPEFINSPDNISQEQYRQWLLNIKQRFAYCQSKAIVKVNAEMLSFYWGLGADIIRMQKTNGWGNGIIKQLSLDLRAEFPSVNGFSVRNLEYMKRWYAFYSERVIKSQQPVAIFNASESHQDGAILSMPESFSFVPWRQHVEIVYKCKSIEEAIFYIEKVVAENWSRNTLLQYIESRLYQRQGQAITNYEKILPKKQSELAKSILRDPYQFDFLEMREKYSERDLEDALVNNITRFLLELGQGFAYVGRQMELRMDGETSYFPDLVFYHYRQKRFIVCELKVTEFMPEYAGKINFYVNAANHLLKGPDDNETIGLLICRSAKESVVKWSFDGIENPIGVATYKLKELVDRTFNELSNTENK